MSTWSALRRSTPPLRRLPHSQLCRFSTSPPAQSPPPPSLTATSNLCNNPNGDDSSAFLRWVSGIITTSALSLAVYSYSSPSVSFADWATPAPATVTAVPSSSVDHCRPKFLFGEMNAEILFADAFRRKVFFNYERRIRMRSPPEKVFEYFASFHGHDGEIFMTPADLMRAVVPVFPPSESNLVREGYLRGERGPGELQCAPSEFFMLFDTNSDGLISFKEYIFFVTLLSIPESSFSVAFKMFDRDCNGCKHWCADKLEGGLNFSASGTSCLVLIVSCSIDITVDCVLPSQSGVNALCTYREIDLAEFKKVMGLMQSHNRQGAHHSDGLRAGHSLGGQVENGGLLEYLFGEDGKQRLQHDKFVQFLRDLHDEIIRLEFAHYDYKLLRTISAKDFALSMVASADLKHLGKLLRQVDHLDSNSQLRNIRISFDEFKSFAELRKRLLPFSLALFSYGEVNGLLTRSDFKRAASQVCGVHLTDNLIEIIFHVFDDNQDGSLSSDEFIRVLMKRETDVGHPTEAGVFSFINCCWNCSRNYRDKLLSMLTSD
nr:calcium uptake protein, mitochondrial [Ipomoea batatas]